MNIHALFSLILTSSAHLFCKGLPNTVPTTFVLLVGLSKTSYISSRDVSIIENVCARDVLVQQTPAPLGTGAWTLTGQTIPIVLSHKTWGISTAPPRPGATLRSTDSLWRRQHAATACSCTKATLTKPAPLQNKSAERKRSQSRFKHTTDHPFQLLAQGDQYEPPKKILLNCTSGFASSYSAFHIPLQKISSRFSSQIIT